MFLMPMWQTGHFRAIVILFKWQPSLSLCFTFYNTWEWLKSVTWPQHSSLLSLHCLWPEKFPPSCHGKHYGPCWTHSLWGFFLELPPHMQAGILGSLCASLSMWIFPTYGEGICFQPEMFFRLFQVQLQRQDYILAIYHQTFLSLFSCLSLSLIYIYVWMIIQIVEITHQLQVQTAPRVCFLCSRWNLLCLFS